MRWDMSVSLGRVEVEKLKSPGRKWCPKGDMVALAPGAQAARLGAEKLPLATSVSDAPAGPPLWSLQ